MSGYPEGHKHQARLKRLVGGMSIRAIAAELGVSKSIVGRWVKGEGEAYYFKTCARCGDGFIAYRSHAMYCLECKG